jgi:phosphoribosylaminoimidazole (AIR) synthetase
MGAVERKDLLPKMEEMRAGDVLIGLRSDGAFALPQRLCLTGR